MAAHARSGSVTRIEGTDRHDTAAAIADALPDKVHDADLLDGLDSSAFLRSNATIDADTLDGRTATDTRSLAVPWPDVVIAPTEHSPNGGLFHPTGMASSATFSVGLPPDRRAGEPLSVILTFSRQQTPPCDIAVQVIGQTLAVDGSTKSRRGRRRRACRNRRLA